MVASGSYSWFSLAKGHEKSVATRGFKARFALVTHIGSNAGFVAVQVVSL
jgi:hypothetical protein